MKITNDIKYVGVNDHDIDLFEGQYDVPNGMAYNSYVVLDEKCAVMDSVDARFGDEWLANIDAVLGGKFAVARVGLKPCAEEYLVVCGRRRRLCVRS